MHLVHGGHGFVWTVLVGLLVSSGLVSAVPAGAAGSATYTNPIRAIIPASKGGGVVESCADPSVLREQGDGVRTWFVYCTTDPLNNNDKKAGGGYNFNLIPILRSTDFIHWTYEGNVFQARPPWVGSDAGLWAPDAEFINGKYYLYYAASDTVAGGSAIGVATADHPGGPWTDSTLNPVVEPDRPPTCCPGAKRATIDPDVIQVPTPSGVVKYIYYGSYFGGISVRQLDTSGFSSIKATQKQITIPNRYEAAEVVVHDGFYYLFGSATNCCNGPLTGYTVFAGRSSSPLGPFVDREGVPLIDEASGGPVGSDARIGGTPVASMNGNRWVGPGHNEVFQDMAGQWWSVYHAVDRNDPVFPPAPPVFTKRPPVLDAIDWVDGWPMVNGGHWTSDSPQPVPVAQPGSTTAHKARVARNDEPGQLIAALSDDFNGAFGSQWSWVRQPASSTYGFDTVDGRPTFRWNVQSADLHTDSRTQASILTEATPASDYMVEVKLRVNYPLEGCCFNYQQGGLLVYKNDTNYVKIDDVSIWDTRQTELGKEMTPAAAGYPEYGNSVIGPPGDWTYLRIVKRTHGSEETYRGYSSRDGKNWVRGGVWTHALGYGARIGLVSMGRCQDPNCGDPVLASHFDYVHVFALKDQEESDNNQEF
jgi:arabinan endo-1,5-alpha-L-arabinosidase